MNNNASFLPTYDNNPEYNAELLRKAIPLMSKHNISTHPINYAIWYEYVAGVNTPLKQAVDEVLSDSVTFNDHTSLELYKKYICNASVDTFEKINFSLKTLIDNAFESIENTTNQVSDVGDNFQKSSVQLTEIDEAKDVKSVLSGLIAETNHLVKISQSLKSELNEANNEMATLRNELSKVKELATTDVLTGLLNRRAFDNELAILTENNMGASNCLLMFDLDHFKRVNDNYGHLVGDKVIRYTGGLLKKYAKEHHHVARYGGEELAVIMPNTDLSEAKTIAEQIRVKLSKSELKQKDNGLTIGKITVSIGITQLKNDDNVESFINRADEALYNAKESGRNRVVVK